MIDTLLRAFAFVCFILATQSEVYPLLNWNRLIALGLALLTASMLPW